MKLVTRRTTLRQMLTVAAGPALLCDPARRAFVEVDYEADLLALFTWLDQHYTFLTLKGIQASWDKARAGLLERAASCTSDEAFLLVVVEAMRQLRDGHLRIREARAPLPARPTEYVPGVSFLPATGDRVVVMHPPTELEGVIERGMIVSRIDDVDARTFLEDGALGSWERGGGFSSPQRARLFVYRQPLRGPKETAHRLTLVGADDTELSIVVRCTHEARGWPHTYNLPADLVRVGRSFHYTALAGDVGYMYLRRVDDSVLEGIDAVRAAIPDASGWIADLRGNGGGGYGADLLERIKAFDRPIAVLIDAGTVSAGETLARDFRRFAGAHLIGEQSAGSSSSKRTFSFPSGVASLVIPVRSRFRMDKLPIEFNGIAPDTFSEAVPEEVAAGKNSTLLRAQEYLARVT